MIMVLNGETLGKPQEMTPGNLKLISADCQERDIKQINNFGGVKVKVWTRRLK
jgi:hypothetical protein